MSAVLEQFPATDVDRAREITSIGAGHAATALAAMIGRPCEMRVPQMRLLPPPRLDTPLAIDPSDGDGRAPVGTFFEIDGGFGGVVGLLFPASTCAALIELMTGKAAEENSPEIMTSVLREAGNILVSHVANAISETLGLAVLPSVPVLAMSDAVSALGSLLATREREGPALRLETEIADRGREIRAVLVFVPDHLSHVAPAPGF